MIQRLANFFTSGIKGMQRDLSKSKYTPDYSFDNMNIRITARDDNTLLTITNEKGNSQEDIGITITGTIIGLEVISNYITLFVKESTSIDKIYRIKYDNETFSSTILFSGDLGFDVKYPIETLGLYETEEIIKVYFIDGLNQPRFINISESADGNIRDSNSFNFIPILNLNETINITKNRSGNGIFPTGVVLYVFSYYNLYGSESNLFYTSDLYYTSMSDRGGSGEEISSNSFTINIINPDQSFDYLRIYSIVRTSLDAVPTVKRLIDLPISGNTITYTDTNTSGDIIDPLELFYKGGEEIIPYTFDLKDNTLFFGNYRINRELINPQIRQAFRTDSNFTINFELKRVSWLPLASGTYPYENTLNFPSREIKTFKYREWYRVGILFLHRNGKLSEPIFIKDVYNNLHAPEVLISLGSSYRTLFLTLINLLFNNSDILLQVAALGYVKARPVVVYPLLLDREVIALGILCPTVYNVKDRVENAPFAQSSWFSRPNLAYDLERRLWLDISDYDSLRLLPKAIITNETYNYSVTDVRDKVLRDNTFRGSWTEFRNLLYLPAARFRNAEILLQTEEDLIPVTVAEKLDWRLEIDKYAHMYAVDNNIITFHSPDVEFNDNLKALDGTNYKLRIVGTVDITASLSNIDITTSTPSLNPNEAFFYKQNFTSNNRSLYAFRGLVSAPFWIDKVFGATSSEADRFRAFPIYPWHRSGSLTNQGIPDVDQVRYTVLDLKKMSNFKFSYETRYINNIWTPSLGITPITVFDSNELEMVRIKSPANSNLPDLNYYGNVDKLLTKSNNSNGYDLYATAVGEGGVITDPDYIYRLFTNPYINIQSGTSTSYDPVRIKYKSSPHLVFALNYISENNMVVLPTHNDMWDGLPANSQSYQGIGTRFIWKLDYTANALVTQDVIQTSGLLFGYYWMAELYNDNVLNRFGGNTEQAFENNLWLPAGDFVSLYSGGNIKTSINLSYTEGDTYYQRYDHLKTYPFTLEDTNSISETVSFMVETRVNIDGRYDRNRGLTTSLILTPSVFNLYNPVYTQRNNFFNFRGIDYERFSLSNFRYSFTWTRPKILGEEIDTWTNITLAGTVDLDGDKGALNKIIKYNNDLIAFLDKAISNILYNSRVLVSNTSGVPIEIANSGLVDGKRYIHDSVGTVNKWSIRKNSSGIYFIDGRSNGIYLLSNEGLRCLSDELGFRSWVNLNVDNEIWNPVDFSGFRTHYDTNDSDIYFTSKDHCLVYSSYLNLFTSFMSYESVPYSFGMNGSFYMWKDNKLWLLEGGDYNMFFGLFKPFHTSIIANSDLLYDKTFSTIDYIGDTFDKDNNYLSNISPFSHLEVWNEYLRNKITLNRIISRPSNLLKKFRVWRANIPRDITNKMDRMRNPWLLIRLSLEIENINKVNIHDIMVKYFV